MTKQEKFKFVEELTEKIKQNPSFYVIDMGGFSVSKTNEFRAKAFAANLQVQVAKNTLIKKALDASEVDYSEIYPALKETSALVFFTENFKAPAQLIKDFRKEGEKPALKAAYVEETFFVGDAHLATLISLKNKNELIGDIVGMLQAPAKNVIGALKGQGSKIAGILKTLEEKGN
ncbi:MAG: 50S ribosomal protein L10 [Bacteroidetes bacterium]|jgi:large subunit ribosomal protein L10|nr:50S ribosomal protein L10 [Bacteroidota bacterium]